VQAADPEIRRETARNAVRKDQKKSGPFPLEDGAPENSKVMNTPISL
jgi:hypothetical protein